MAIPPLKKDIPVKDKIDPELHIKAAPFRKEIRQTQPHKHNQYVEIIFLTSGSGAHWIDEHRYEVQPPVLFFVNKDQVHNWDLETEPGGYVVILKKSFTEKSLDQHLHQLLSAIRGITCLPVAAPQQLLPYFDLLAAESLAGTESSFTVLEGVLKALLAKIKQLAQEQLNQLPQRNELYQLFLELISRDQPLKNKVAHYAARLNTTPQNLNAACRKAADTTAAGVLTGYIIHEAKRLLLYTDQTVSEISFRLNFNDPSHFVKYFKRSTGHTPQFFRTTR